MLTAKTDTIDIVEFVDDIDPSKDRPCRRALFP
jgi:hypothetical protein